jgi:hypothetical protein
MEIIEINHGIACRIENIIYLNKNLRKYPKLRKAIIEHEKAHSDNFNMNDIKMDMSISHLANLKKEYYSFILHNPSSFTELLPVGLYNKKLVLNPTLIGFWCIVGGLIWLIVSLSK